jgi:hypothetical protein
VEELDPLQRSSGFIGARAMGCFVLYPPTMWDWPPLLVVWSIERSYQERLYELPTDGDAFLDGVEPNSQLAARGFVANHHPAPYVDFVRFWEKEDHVSTRRKCLLEHPGTRVPLVIDNHGYRFTHEIKVDLATTCEDRFPTTLLGTRHYLTFIHRGQIFEMLLL